MEVRDAHQEALAPALDGRLADLRRRAVARLFYETTSRHVERDARDWGVGEDEVVEGRLAAGAKTEEAPRKRGRARTGRGDAPPWSWGWR
jgi:hypothetical protein